MKAVWDRETVTVRDVYEALLEKRKVAYTTVMTMMNILEQKGHLEKPQEDPAFVNRVFNGSAEPLLLHLVEDRKLSEKDIVEIRSLIRKERAK